MPRPPLEVADIFRAYGPAWPRANAGHVSLDQLKVMSAIENCRTAALGGHVARCEKCAHTLIAYNSCRNRHCPKCQGLAAKQWLAEREAELLPVPYYHVVFTLPAAIEHPHRRETGLFVHPVENLVDNLAEVVPVSAFSRGTPICQRAFLRLRGFKDRNRRPIAAAPLQIVNGQLSL